MPLRFRITSNHPTLAASAETKEFAACGGTIGRNSNNDWVLRDDSCYVSGQHALIDFQAGAYYLIDTAAMGSISIAPINPSVAATPSVCLMVIA